MEAFWYCESIHRHTYAAFTPEFLTGMKKELKLLVRHAKMIYNWETAPGSKAYNDRLARKEVARAKAAERRVQEGRPDSAQTRVSIYTSWKEDAGERSRRIWEWWKNRVKSEDDFKFFKTAVRLVALTQVSSASVERVFSQLVRIKKECGETMLEETVFLRLLCRLHSDEDVPDVPDDPE